MAITTTDRLAGPFRGDNETTEWPFDFVVYDKSHLRVVLARDGQEYELTADSDFEVVLNDDQQDDPGGFIRYPHPDMDPPGSPLTHQETLVITTAAPAVQITAFKSAGGFHPQTVEQRLDYLTILAQQLMERMKHVPEAGITDTANLSLGTATQRAQRFLGFDEDGDAVFVATPAIDPDFQDALNQLQATQLVAGEGLDGGGVLSDGLVTFELSPATLMLLSAAGTAVQPGDLADVAFSGDYGDIINVPSTFPPAAHTHSASDITSGTLSDARLPATIGGDKTFSDNVAVGGTLTVGTHAQIFVEAGLVAGSDVVIRTTQGSTWSEIRALDGGSGNAGLLVRASGNSGEDWTDILRATPAEIQLDATLLDFNGNADISGTLAVGGAATFSSNVTVGGTITGNGSGLSSLNASNLSSGTVPSDRLPSTIGGNKTFSGNVAVGGNVNIGGTLATSSGFTVTSSGNTLITNNSPTYAWQEADTGEGYRAIVSGGSWYLQSTTNGVDTIIRVDLDANSDISAITLSAATLQFNGDADISGNLTVGGTITETSDARLKSDLRVIEGALDKVRQLTGYTFSTANGVRSAGVIAQDVQRVFPEAVVERQDGMLTVGYGRLLGLLIEAIKELADRR